MTAVEGMVEEARSLDVLAIAAVGTAGLRMASNRDTVLATIAERTGVEVEVIPGEEESRLAFQAVRSGLTTPGGTLAVLDTGGGSTQLTFGHEGSVDEQWSVNVGAVRYTERSGSTTRSRRRCSRRRRPPSRADLARLDGRAPVDALVGMGGASPT